MKNISKPGPGESAPYTLDYIQMVPDGGRVLQHLQDNSQTIKNYLRSLPAAKLTTPHKEGEWTVQEVLGHVIDTERVFGYRALRIARNDKTDLPGFEQADYVPYAGANARSLEDLLAEYTTLRAATMTLFNSFDDAAWERSGTASGYTLTVRAAVYIVAGHELYHLRSIKENYGA
ncbi:MAG: DinB family protein [Chloroflexota bacterium]